MALCRALLLSQMAPTPTEHSYPPAQAPSPGSMPPTANTTGTGTVSTVRLCGYALLFHLSWMLVTFFMSLLHVGSTKTGARDAGTPSKTVGHRGVHA